MGRRGRGARLEDLDVHAGGFEAGLGLLHQLEDVAVAAVVAAGGRPASARLPGSPLPAGAAHGHAGNRSLPVTSAQPGPAHIIKTVGMAPLLPAERVGGVRGPVGASSAAWTRRAWSCCGRLLLGQWLLHRCLHRIRGSLVRVRAETGSRHPKRPTAAYLGVEAGVLNELSFTARSMHGMEHAVYPPAQHSTLGGPVRARPLPMQPRRGVPSEREGPAARRCPPPDVRAWGAVRRGALPDPPRRAPLGACATAPAWPLTVGRIPRAVPGRPDQPAQGGGAAGDAHRGARAGPWAAARAPAAAAQGRGGAQTVIDLSPAWVRSLVNQEAYGADAAGRERSLLAVSQHTVKVADLPATDLLRHLPAAVDFIQGALGGGGTCLVHCMAGISRSTTVSPSPQAQRGTPRPCVARCARRCCCGLLSPRACRSWPPTSCARRGPAETPPWPPLGSAGRSPARTRAS